MRMGIQIITLEGQTIQWSKEKGQSRGTDNNGHRTNKRWRIPKGQSKKDNPE